MGKKIIFGLLRTYFLLSISTPHNEQQYHLCVVVNVITIITIVTISTPSPPFTIMCNITSK